MRKTVIEKIIFFLQCKAEKANSLAATTDKAQCEKDVCVDALRTAIKALQTYADVRSGASKVSYEYRIGVHPDQEQYDPGDGTDEELAEIWRMVEQFGVWGFVTERRITGLKGAQWEDIDSCWGFVGNDQAYMLEQAMSCLPESVQGKVIPIVDERGTQINTVKVKCA